MTPNSGYHPIQLRIRSKKSLHKCLKVFTKLKGNDDAECNSWKAHEETLLAATKKSDSSEHVSSSPNITNSQEEEDVECQSVPGEEFSQYPFDYQVHLDKLQAVLLHVLASGQWNASRLKMCHRYIVITFAHLLYLRCV